MNKPTFFIYDYESFGVSPASDRIAQFAGIRTDENFNIIGEPIMLFCQQTADYLPSPESVIITGITPQECNQKGIIEPHFISQIYEQFSQPNTCIMGYNNIRYDDELTRYTLFRNFFDPYEYSYKNGNSRWDLLDVVRACYALRPDGIQWPMDENGMPSFKLENLTQANGIEHLHAHDAMSDVYATIEVAKLLKQKQPKLFEFFYQNRSKDALKAIINTGEMIPLVHVSGMLGNYRGNTTWIAPLAWHPYNNNALIVCDLSGDIEVLLNESSEQLKQKLYTKKSRLEAENLSSVPIKLVHINKCPILAPAKTLTPNDAQRLGIDRQRCLENLTYIKNNKSMIRNKVIEIFNEKFSAPLSENVETTLYDGFFSPADRNNMAILRTLPSEKLAQHGLKFADERIEKLLFHYRAKYFPSTLSRAEQIKWQKYCQQRINSQIINFNRSIDELSEKYHNDPEKLSLLTKLIEYAENLSLGQHFEHHSTESSKLVESLNEVANQQYDKAHKLAILKRLIK